MRHQTERMVACGFNIESARACVSAAAYACFFVRHVFFKLRCLVDCNPAIPFREFASNSNWKEELNELNECQTKFGHAPGGYGRCE